MKHIVVGTAGHIDHGKSALVQALTGTDPDRLKEEKARGITIDLGFAHWETPAVSVSFVDVPGHERFVRNMLAGVGGLDAVMLIVAADESVMPQTREHFEICRLLRVPAGLVIVTKIDLVDDETVGVVRAEVEELVRASFLAGAPVVPVSARTGAGLDALRRHLEDLGKAAAPRRADGPVRLPIDRVFSMKGFGTVVTGTLVSGEVAPDVALVALPGGLTAKVRGVQAHGERQVRGVAGQRIAVNLGGVETSDLARGQTLTSPGAFEAARVVDVRVELIESARPLRHGARVRFHQGTSEVLGRVALSSLLRESGPGVPGEAEAPVEVPPGRSAYARIRLEAPVVVTRHDRFIVRAYSPPDTIGGGVVIDPRPPRGGIRTAVGRARFRELDPEIAGDSVASATERAAQLLAAEAGGAGLPIAALTSRLGLVGRDGRGPIERLQHSGSLTPIGAVLVATSSLSALGTRLLDLVGLYHRDHPIEAGISREEARERVFSRAAPGVFEHVVNDLVRSGRIVATDRIGLTGYRAESGSAEAVLRDAVISRYRESGLRPPDQTALAESLEQPVSTVAGVVALLVRQRTLVRVDTLVFHEAALRQLKDDVRALRSPADGPPAVIDVAMFKDLYGVTRKYAIPLLEYLDRERITRRVGDGRVVI
jgi:selenocysteine-specific elongation factor